MRPIVDEHHLLSRIISYIYMYCVLTYIYIILYKPIVHFVTVHQLVPTQPRPQDFAWYLLILGEIGRRDCLAIS
jgi:hypothetical protein